ncbi:GntR family transcriptional regulator [Streptomyces ipomoeae]|uniref:GntR family transcriptional regulator n=1 Tax=Streptomyces ipomoeae TaxID=103232 RepID=UPI0029A9C985|nr:GntR family transcriptional regulator [Streptomyces ipomoeae]MDX2697154.1 GntR family transcriptional regulator [Streptomyces ipomoeae]MDX2843064.1 GntR family transcriptional regulator [Streptomyces ipomoeae]
MTEPRTPKWRQLADEVRRRIDDGTYPRGTALPQIKPAAEAAGVSYETMRAAYKALESEGLVRSVKRTGFVVLETPGRRRITRGSIITRDPARGYIFPAAARPDEPWEVHGRPFRSFVPAPDVVAEHFGIEPGAETLRRRRVTSPAGEPPFQLVDTWLSPDAVNDAPQVAEASTGPGGYLDRLEEAGHGPISWTETVRVRMPEREEAQLLSISTAMPILETTIVGTSTRTERPLEVTIRVIPGDRVELFSELQRARSARWPVTPVKPK